MTPTGYRWLGVDIEDKVDGLSQRNPKIKAAVERIRFLEALKGFTTWSDGGAEAGSWQLMTASEVAVRYR